MIDKDLADVMTRSILLKDIKRYPERNDFRYPVRHREKDYTIVWNKDINVLDPKWHISIEQL